MQTPFDPNAFLDQPLPCSREPERVYSEFQHAIFGAVQQPKANVLVQAVAGSGKTTTLVQAIEYAPGISLFMAFNRAIAEELRGRVTSGQVMTLNALGHSVLMRHRAGAKLDPKKTQAILARNLGEDSPLLREHGYTMTRIIGLAKNNAFLITNDGDSSDFEALIDQFDIPSELTETVIGHCRLALRDSLKMEEFDFDDQLWIPLYHNWPYPHYDNVFVDECQDLSPIQHLMLNAFVDARSRLVAMGDRHQAIYGFRGAMTYSMDALKRRFGMLELPLSISYRCSQAVVREAQAFCPTIQPRPGAPEGHVRWLDWDESDPEFFSDALIMCRNNAPLFRVILRHVRAKKPIRVLSNFLEGFQSFIRGFRVGTTAQLEPKLDRWFEKEQAAAEAKGFSSKLAALSDKYETAKLFCQEYRTTQEIIDVLKQIASGTAGPIFATIHKAKGLEHDHAYILRPDLMPAFYAKTPEARQQEANLQYVAITRAKGQLTYGKRSG